MTNKSAKLWMALVPALWVVGCATQQTGSWEQIGTTEQGSVAYSVDKSSIQRNGQKVTFKSQAKYLKAGQLPTNLPAHSAAITSWEMNCDSGVYRPLHTQLVDSNGKVVYSSEVKQQDFQPAPSRETAMYRQRQVVCKGK
ncbi:MAG: hypothetical protein IJM09_02120 [Neisseriaceae bacterium]|nr:hypothetical protein [Neisseriaceae bacterium]